MVEVEAPSEGATQVLPDQENIDLADRLMERFAPDGGQGLNAMLSNRAKSGAMVLAGLGFFIWLSVFFNLDSSTETDDTILLNFSFHTIAIVVALLSFLAAIFSELGSERGRAAPSLMAGPMQFFAIIYVFEPLATGGMSDALTVEEGLWRSIRLLVIFGGAYYGARLIMEAYFLVWLRTFCDTFGYVPGDVQRSLAAAVPEVASPDAEMVLELEDLD